MDTARGHHHDDQDDQDGAAAGGLSFDHPRNAETKGSRCVQCLNDCKGEGYAAAKKSWVHVPLNVKNVEMQFAKIITKLCVTLVLCPL